MIMKHIPHVKHIEHKFHTDGMDLSEKAVHLIQSLINERGDVGW